MHVCVCVCDGYYMLTSDARIRSLIGRYHFGREFQSETKVNIKEIKPGLIKATWKGFSLSRSLGFSRLVSF